MSFFLLVKFERRVHLTLDVTRSLGHYSSNEYRVTQQETQDLDSFSWSICVADEYAFSCEILSNHPVKFQMRRNSELSRQTWLRVVDLWIFLQLVRWIVKFLPSSHCHARRMRLPYLKLWNDNLTHIFPSRKRTSSGRPREQRNTMPANLGPPDPSSGIRKNSACRCSDGENDGGPKGDMISQSKIDFSIELWNRLNNGKGRLASFCDLSSVRQKLAVAQSETDAATQQMCFWRLQG